MALYADIEKSYRGFHLKARFQADNGILALLGASGSGKSLTLKCLAGLIRPDRGVIQQDGVTLFDSARGVDLPPQRRNVGLLLQSYALFPNMTLRKNVEAGLHRVKDRAQRQQQALDLIRAFHLDGLEGHYPNQLSGGQQQRAALCRILASKPSTLLLDEPFAALDHFLKWQLEQELSDILREFPGAVIYVSHDRDEVYSLCDRVCAMDRGRTEAVRPVKAFFAQPETLQGALLSGCKNISRAARMGSHRIFAQDWGTDLETAHEVPMGIDFVGVRARDVRLGGTPGDANVLACVFTRLEESLDGFTLQFRPLSAAEDSPAPGIRVELGRHAPPLQIGQTACLTIPADGMMLLK